MKVSEKEINLEEIKDKVLNCPESLPKIFVKAFEILESEFFTPKIELINRIKYQCFQHKRAFYGVVVRMNGSHKGEFEVCYTHSKNGWQPLRNPIDGIIQGDLTPIVNAIIELQLRADYHLSKKDTPTKAQNSYQAKELPNR